jgi:hypothetical protein
VVTGHAKTEASSTRIASPVSAVEKLNALLYEMEKLSALKAKLLPRGSKPKESSKPSDGKRPKGTRHRRTDGYLEQQASKFANRKDIPFFGVEDASWEDIMTINELQAAAGDVVLPIHPVKHQMLETFLGDDTLLELYSSGKKRTMTALETTDCMAVQEAMDGPLQPSFLPKEHTLSNWDLLYKLAVKKMPVNSSNSLDPINHPGLIESDDDLDSWYANGAKELNQPESIQLDTNFTLIDLAA